MSEVDPGEAQRALDRILQLHAAEPHKPQPEDPQGFTWSVCRECRTAAGFRVVMPCPTTQIIRGMERRRRA